MGPTGGRRWPARGRPPPREAEKGREGGERRGEGEGGRGGVNGTERNGADVGGG